MRRSVIVIICATAGAVAGVLAIALLGAARHPTAMRAAPQLAAAGPASAAQPRVETLPCWFPVPAGRSARCGRLIVPEDWDDLSSRSLALRFVVFPGSQGDAAEPLIYVSGGPGEPAQIDAAGIGRWWQWTSDSDWLGRRDLVVFDQRGVGLSEPDLGCPELVQVGPKLFTAALGAAETDAAWADAATRCHRRLAAAGVRLDRYNTAATVRDIAALVGGLQYRHWSFLAVSYGTRVVFEFLRQYPDGTRSAILDSVLPPGVRPYLSAGTDAARALDLLVAGCMAEPGCKSANPDLGRALADIVQRAALHPLAVPLPAAGDPGRRAMLDDAKLVEVLFYGLYRKRDIKRLPDVITALARGNVGPLAPLAAEALETYESAALSHGLYLSVECHDEYPFDPPEAVRRAAAAAGRFEHFVLANVPVAACPVWPVGAASDGSQAPVASDVPILMLSGELDPVTPPEWAKTAAATLSHARLFRFPEVGHGVLAADRCADRVVASFLAKPDQAPFDHCLLALGQAR
ncbi:MAG TPA: alpha/beta fold hydrolase [Aliidongia sp.]|nr:alpha/beta fold hydrolase [Aliidongia sp.]